MYSGDPCPYCAAAKALLKSKNLEIEEFDIWKDPEKARKTATDHYWSNPEKNRKLSRENARKHRADPVKNLETNRKRRARNYGLTYEQSVAVESYIGKPCHICTETVKQRGKYGFCVDHDHETGEVRGVICSRCNTALGLFEDDPNRLRTAISYLQN